MAKNVCQQKHSFQKSDNAKQDNSNVNEWDLSLCKYCAGLQRSFQKHIDIKLTLCKSEDVKNFFFSTDHLIVNGKVNTLSDNAEKIRQVSHDVAAAIQEAREEDARLKQLIESGDQSIDKETTHGKRYLVDLLCSKVIVRVQAEGFNG